MMETVTTIAFAALAVAAALFLLRLVRGPSLADRIISLDALLGVVVSGIAVFAARTGSGIFLDALVVAALLGFVGTVTVARFIERRGA
jgi:multicomponent Na+:H+ antiporter subunit F